MEGAVPRLGADVPRWYGETIGFWDGDVLVRLDVQYPGMENARCLRVLESAADHRDLHAHPQSERRARGAAARGRSSTIRKRSWNHCGSSAICAGLSGIETRRSEALRRMRPDDLPVKGKATPLTPGATFTYEVPDMFGRPWAQMWERYNERGMEKPVDDTFFDFGR